ncbi:MAG: Fic family protein, partial [Armatimonadetes bacterium]|nr:Fic family protein [Armatimonadota bacterium]
MARFDRDRPYNDLPLLPPSQEVETPRVLKKAISASRALGEFQGVEAVIEHSTDSLVRAIGLQEAKISSEIENIVTTNDELYQEFGEASGRSNSMIKEVFGYLEAVWH